MEFDILNFYETYHHGPIQKDEALFLIGLCYMVRPKVVVEFGFLNGKSARAFLACPTTENVYSFDIFNHRNDITDNRFKLIINPQEKFSPEFIENKKIDLCFIDASHNVELNLITFDQIQSSLSKNAIIAVHDTGLFSRKGWDKSPESYKRHHLHYGEHFIQNEFMPAVQAERDFVDALRGKYPHFKQIHFHAPDYYRNGITLLQSNTILNTKRHI